MSWALLSIPSSDIHLNPVLLRHPRMPVSKVEITLRIKVNSLPLIKRRRVEKIVLPAWSRSSRKKRDCNLILARRRKWAIWSLPLTEGWKEVHLPRDLLPRCFKIVFQWMKCQNWWIRFTTVMIASWTARRKNWNSSTLFVPAWRKNIPLERLSRNNARRSAL